MQLDPDVPLRGLRPEGVESSRAFQSAEEGRHDSTENALESCCVLAATLRSLPAGHVRCVAAVEWRVSRCATRC